jgi:glucose/arabinose dehydrogenase
MKTNKWILTILIIGIIAIAVPVVAAFPTPERSMPEGAGTIVYLPTITRSPLLPPPDEASQRISLPDGFAIRIYAQNLNGRPRFMTIGPDGHLYVSLIDRGQVVRLPDRDGNWQADGVEVIASGLNAPHGIEFYNGSLYIASVDRIARMTGPDTSGDFGPVETVTTALPAPGGHDTRTVHFGPDGKMYVSVGSSCNLCEETDPRRAAIIRFNPDGSIPADNPFANDPDPARQPVYAYGLRNSVDFLWSPSGELWADHNGVDGLGNDIPPEEIVIPVQAGASHGWPYCYTPTQGINTSA